MKAFNEQNKKQADFEKSDVGFHGDVIVQKTILPENFKNLPRVEDDCLAYGEATGHRHQLFSEPNGFDLRVDPQTQIKFLQVILPTTIKHQEHSPIELPPGNYRIGLQREYDPFSKRARAIVD